jgi:hypothetical protein
MMRGQGAVGWLFAVLLVILALPCVALADATPVQLILLYMPNVSNTGTTSASGIAELVMPEGEVRITAAELPRLEGTEEYAVWVLNSDTNQFQKIGAFNSVQSTSAVHYENVLPDAIPNNHWNLLLVTVEDDATAIRPNARHSIAGVFPNVDTQPLPGHLPNPGGEPVDQGSGVRGQGPGADWTLVSGLAALTSTIGAAAGYGVGKQRSSRSA